MEKITNELIDKLIEERKIALETKEKNVKAILEEHKKIFIETIDEIQKEFGYAYRKLNITNEMELNGLHFAFGLHYGDRIYISNCRMDINNCGYISWYNTISNYDIANTIATQFQNEELFIKYKEEIKEILRKNLEKWIEAYRQKTKECFLESKVE